MRGFDLKTRTKVVRHEDPSRDLRDLRRLGWLETYQSYGGPGTFERCDYIVSFLTEIDRSNRFFGVFQVLGWDLSANHPLPPGFPIEGALYWGRHFDLRRVSAFDDFVDCVVIDWRARMWHRWLNEAYDPEVIEVLPRGFVRSFPGYLDLLISFDDLQRIVSHPDVHRDWHRMLSVPGVYLITDCETGNQYVGSATGVHGIIARWATYAFDGHGGNKHLKALVEGQPGYARNFQYSILRTLSPELHRNEGVRQEQLYKAKLGRRATSLNAN
ncbi:MAG TPA: GIY-YIG nuclease family protein [Longimicrobiaceae bacterium]|nr:GIY-YIG nuclease family protein [Longimicrobiaceae bacterium]